MQLFVNRLKVDFLWFQMEVIVGDFGIVVVPRDGADTERIMNHSSILRKYKVRPQYSNSNFYSVGGGNVLVQYLISVHCSRPQDNIIVVKDVMNHPMSIVSSTKSR